MTRVPITNAIREELKRLRADTGVGAMRLLRGQLDHPKGLNSANISTWLSGKSASAKKEHLDYVLLRWRQADSILDVTSEMVATLNGEFQRTGLSANGFLNGAKSLPKGFGAYQLSGLRTGKRKTIPESQWTTLIDVLSELPDQIKASPAKPYIGRPLYVTEATDAPPEKVASTYASKAAATKSTFIRNLPDDLKLLTADEVDRLITLRAKSGVGAIALLRHFESEKPDRLSANTISAWINGHVKYASKSRLCWVLEKWESVPTKTNK